MPTATDIIARLGGSAVVARETGFPLTTIEGWKEVNFVPAWRQQALIDVAHRLKLRVDRTEFPSVSERRPRPKAGSTAPAHCSACNQTRSEAERLACVAVSCPMQERQAA